MKKQTKPENSLMNADVIVVGAGMVGSMITKHLRANGLQVLLIDCERPFSGSKCSSGMWRDGWVNDKIREQYEQGLEVLHEYAGINTIEVENLDTKLSVKKNGSEQTDVQIDELMYVNWKDICDVQAVNYEVVSVCKNIVTCRHHGNDHNNRPRTTQFVAMKKVFLCTGAYTDELLRDSGYSPIGLDRYFGSAIETRNLDYKIISKIKTWAPYKQFLAARVGKTKLKFSDGSMVKNPPLEQGDERCDRVHQRLKEHVVEVMGTKFKYDKDDTKELFGLRPYLPKGDHEFVHNHDSDLWSFTGTAKNTTILCGYLAIRALEIATSPKARLVKES